MDDAGAGKNAAGEEGFDLWKGQAYGKRWCDARSRRYKEGRMSMGNSDTRIVSCIIGLLEAVVDSLWGRGEGSAN
jgi:hypothetical protein